MKLRDFLKNNIVYLDGGMGTILQGRGLKIGELPEIWNLSHAEEIINIHKAYFDAGCNIVNTNTFGANDFKFSDDELEKIIKTAIDNAKIARASSDNISEKWIALDIGPTGKMLAPYGNLDFEDAVFSFKKTIEFGVKYGADLIMIETMNDSYETKAALLAAKESSDLPVFVSNAYNHDGHLMTGADSLAMISMLEGMGVDAIGVNCSFGPKMLSSIVEKYLEYASVPIIMKPNAGLPKSIDGKTVYDVLPDEFSDDVALMVEKGVRIVGGCCGTTPEYIKKLVDKTQNIKPKEIIDKNLTMVSSYTHAVVFGEKPILIGERINPTGKKKFKEALKSNNMEYILKEGILQQEKGAAILDVNVGLPDIDEVKMLEKSVCELQAIIDLPLQIDTSNMEAMEAALRRYNGKAMINSVSGKDEIMDIVFPLAKKYGGLIVALTLDDSGIPDNVEGRINIAKKIIARAKEYGISKKDLIFDTLAMTISADRKAAKETLNALNIIKNEMGCHTLLGVSNVSFGLPGRDIINSNFFAIAMWHGLSAAIMNPYSDEMLKAYYAYCAIAGLDDNCSDFIEFAEKIPKNTPIEYKSDLQKAIIKGLKDEASDFTLKLLDSKEPLDIIQEEIVPALNIVGDGFEKKTIYLPQLLMSAEAAKASFEQIKSKMSADKAKDKGIFIIATVHGDIHDIGKNIVKLLLDNYGFDVVDLGYNVSPETIVAEAIRLNASIVGLSALMTTTVVSMEETILLLREKAPWVKIMVGGAVLSPEYAASIGADIYAKDAMEAVRFALEINKSLRRN